VRYIGDISKEDTTGGGGSRPKRLGPPLRVGIGRVSGVGALWDCVPRVCGGGGGCASGGVPMGAVPALSWCGEVSLGGKRNSAHARHVYKRRTPCDTGGGGHVDQEEHSARHLDGSREVA